MSDTKTDFSLEQFSFREFEAFLIILANEGEKLSVIKKIIDLRFQHTSRTKGYDYINQLCAKILCSDCKSVNISKIKEEKEEIKYRCNPCSLEFSEKDLSKNNYLVIKKKVNSSTRIYVQKDARLLYEKFILPTISNFRKITSELLEENVNQAKSIEKNRERFKNFTEILSENIKDMIKNTSASAIKKQRFLKRVDDLIWGYFRTEMLKTEFF